MKKAAKTTLFILALLFLLFGIGHTCILFFRIFYHIIKYMDSEDYAWWEYGIVAMIIGMVVIIQIALVRYLMRKLKELVSKPTPA